VSLFPEAVAARFLSVIGGISSGAGRGAEGLNLGESTVVKAMQDDCGLQ
jgi:hypothetical protein